MISGKALKLPCKSAELIHEIVEAAVRRCRPNFSSGHYTYVSDEVYNSLCQDTEDALLEQPTEKWTPDLLNIHFDDQKVEAHLTLLEIKVGRMVLFEKDINGY